MGSLRWTSCTVSMMLACRTERPPAAKSSTATNTEKPSAMAQARGSKRRVIWALSTTNRRNSCQMPQARGAARTAPAAQETAASTASSRFSCRRSWRREAPSASRIPVWRERWRKNSPEAYTVNMAQPITAITKIISTCLRVSPPSGSTARMVGERIMMP